jgi:hypothetical protein
MYLIDAINLAFYEALREQSLVDLMEKEREKKGSRRV